FFQAEDGIRDDLVTGVQTCALPISGDQIALVEPPARETLNLRKQMLLWKTLVIAEMRVEQMLGEVEADFRRPQPLQHKRRDGDRSEERRVGEECRVRGWESV